MMTLSIYLCPVQVSVFEFDDLILILKLEKKNMYKNYIECNSFIGAAICKYFPSVDRKKSGSLADLAGHDMNIYFF